MNKRVSISTLGCKLNQYDGEMMLTQFRAGGFRVVEENSEADVCIVNACAVTSEAERKGRAVIRSVKRKNPGAKLVVAGCLSERSSDSLQKMDGIHAIIGNKEKERILDFVAEDSIGLSVAETRAATTWTDGLIVRGLTGRVRAHLKIQDGCSQFCTYCIIPKLRGHGRSRSLESVVEGARQLVDAGFQEIVLTGVALGTYGMDEGKTNALVGVLKALSRIDGLHRLRLGSVEPWAVTNELLETIAASDVICPHLHIPFQSGDDFVLHRMNRRYTVADLERILNRAFQLRSDWGFGSDIIVGFPGESKAHFANTRRFLENSPLFYLHVFPFSARPNTPALKLDEAVEHSERTDRARILRDLDHTLRRKFREKNIGSIHDVILEDRISGEFITGHSRNYLDVSVTGGRDSVGRRVKVLVEKHLSNGVQGIIIN